MKNYCKVLKQKWKLIMNPTFSLWFLQKMHVKTCSKVNKQKQSWDSGWVGKDATARKDYSQYHVDSAHSAVVDDWVVNVLG